MSVPARAPTTPPDIGASTNRPCAVAWTALATSREEVGSIVLQSMKRRSGGATVEGEGSGGRDGLRMLWKTFLTWGGSGRMVIVTS